jgi:putative aminopeptidase FrvX
MDQREELLKALTEAHGVPGYESEVRNLIRGYLAPVGTIAQDKMGSLTCRLDGPPDGPKVLLAGHMDEIGFMVRHITKEGYVSSCSSAAGGTRCYCATAW